MIYHYSVPLDPARRAGLAGHAPVKKDGKGQKRIEQNRIEFVSDF
jgi:hypothetical protein